MFVAKKNSSKNEKHIIGQNIDLFCVFLFLTITKKKTGKTKGARKANATITAIGK